MKTSQNHAKVRYLCYAAIIAALYVALTLISGALGLASGAIQVRISEALCVLPFFTPAAIPGVTIGCFIYNLIFVGNPLDIIFGTLATLIGAVGTYLLRRYKWVAPLPPVLSNAIIVPFVLAYGYDVEQAIPFMMLTVGVGEIISIYVLGMLLYTALYKRTGGIFNA